MDLLIFLSFLESLDFFERYRMDDSVMKRTKEIMTRSLVYPRQEQSRTYRARPDIGRLCSLIRNAH
jgi:hypothetical protein